MMIMRLVGTELAEVAGWCFVGCSVFCCGVVLLLSVVGIGAGVVFVVLVPFLALEVVLMLALTLLRGKR